MPYLEQDVNSRSVAHMSETMEQMRMIGAYLEQETERRMKRCVQYRADGSMVLDREDFRQVPEVFQTPLLHEMLCRAAGRRKDIEAVHVRMLEELLEKQVGRRTELPYGVRALRCYEGIELTVSHRERYREDKSREIALSGREGAAALPWPAKCLGTCADVLAEKGGGRVRWRIFDRKEDIIIFPKNPYTKWFDYDIINNTVKIRRREPGDYITISKNGGVQKLKQYFVNERYQAG